MRIRCRGQSQGHLRTAGWCRLENYSQGETPQNGHSAGMQTFYCSVYFYSSYVSQTRSSTCRLILAGGKSRFTVVSTQNTEVILVLLLINYYILYEQL